MNFFSNTAFKIITSGIISVTIIAGSVVSPMLSPNVSENNYVDAAQMGETTTELIIETTTEETTQETTQETTTSKPTTTRKKSKYKAKQNVKTQKATGDKKKDEDKGNDKVVDNSLKEEVKVPEKDKIEEQKPAPLPDFEVDNDDSKYEDTDDFFKSKYTKYRYADTSNAIGWKRFGSNMYYFDENHNALKGMQRISDTNADNRYRNYYFNEYGAKSSLVGIDVSRHNGNINWNKLKNDGIEYAIIRLGFRGYGTSSPYKPPIIDDKFDQNMQGAKAAGIPVGLYFYSQAINVDEAMEEAGVCIDYAKKYNIKYPIYFDTEFACGDRSGRADKLTRDERTEIAVAFCESIRNAGYTPGVYASKYFYYDNLDFSRLKDYQIWVAHYTRGKTDFRHNYRMWQYTSSGDVSGIANRTDMNISLYDYVKKTSMTSYGKNTLLLNNNDFNLFVNSEKAIKEFENNQNEENKQKAMDLVNKLPNDDVKKELLKAIENIKAKLDETTLPAETTAGNFLYVALLT